MSYKALIQRLFKVNLFGGVKLGLTNCKRLQKALNFPDQHFKSIQVAGTNGKGSVVTKIAGGLQAAGYRVGLYTSPHLSCFRERIRINGCMISEKEVEELLPILFELTEKEQIPATFFELTTFLAFLHFAREEIDIAVLETGLGGRLDATTIVNPLLSVITSISLDHTEILGTTIEAIAQEKAGIIKPTIPVIVGPRVPTSIVQEMASSFGSPFFQVKQSSPIFEIENRLIAKAALDYLASTLQISPVAIKVGLEKRQPCRFEIFQSSCPVILDVAHNPDGIQHLFDAVEQQFPGVKRRLLFGLSKNKDVKTCLTQLAHLGQDFHPVEALNGRGLPVEELKKELLETGVFAEQIFLSPSISSSFELAMQLAAANSQILVVCGSFFIMSEVRQALGLKEPIDEIDLNERRTSSEPSVDLYKRLA